MKKLLPYALLVFVLFAIITNPIGSATFAGDVLSGLGNFAAALTGGGK